MGEQHPRPSSESRQHYPPGLPRLPPPQLIQDIVLWSLTSLHSVPGVVGVFVGGVGRAPCSPHSLIFHSIAVQCSESERVRERWSVPSVPYH